MVDYCHLKRNCVIEETRVSLYDEVGGDIMKKWEYHVINWDAKVDSVKESQDLQEALNEYGDDGWEVVTMTHQIKSLNYADNNSVSAVGTDSVIIVMKRPNNENESGE